MSLSPSPLADGKTSTSWLSRVRQRDPQAWRRLTELYGPLVYHWGRRQGLSAEDASDVTQEVFAAVAGAVDHFLHSPERGTFRGWLWTIARNKLRDHFRRASGREQADGGTEAFQRLASIPELWSDDSHDATDPRELQRLFRRALERVRCESGFSAICVGTRHFQKHLTLRRKARKVQTKRHLRTLCELCAWA